MMTTMNSTTCHVHGTAIAPMKIRMKNLGATVRWISRALIGWGVLTIAALVFFLPGIAFALGGDLVNNGGGLAEKNVLLAYQNLERHMRTCLAAESCRLTDGERTLLTQITDAMPSEHARANQISFISEQAQPGTFRIDGEMKIAKTGNAVGSPVLVNIDLLYTKGVSGRYEAMSLPDAVAMLVHEFGHHQGERSHQALDVLGLKVASILQRNTYSTPLLPLQDQVSIHVLNGSDSDNPFPEILLYVTDEIFDLTQNLRDAVICPLISVPISIGPIDPITIPGHRPKGYMLHNLYWKTVDDYKSSTKFEANGNLTLDCDGNGLQRGNTNFTVWMEFTADKKEVQPSGFQWKLRPGSVAIRQARKPWLRLIAFP